MPPFQSRSEARAHLRKLRLSCSDLKPGYTKGPPCASLGRFLCDLVQGGVPPPKPQTSEAKIKGKSASGGLRGRSPRGRRLGEEHPSHQPGALGSFLGVKAKPLRGRCASLDPHPLRQCPSKPLRGPLARFSSEGRSGVGAFTSPVGRGHGLDATGAAQACRQGVRALFPGTLPLGEWPAGPPEALMGVRCRGTPCLGFQGARSPWRAAQQTKPSAEGEHFCSSSFALRLFTAPRGPKSTETEGTPESHR